MTRSRTTVAGTDTRGATGRIRNEASGISALPTGASRPNAPRSPEAMASAYCLAAAITGEGLAGGRFPFFAYWAAGAAPAAGANNSAHHRPGAMHASTVTRKTREGDTHDRRIPRLQSTTAMREVL